MDEDEKNAEKRISIKELESEELDHEVSRQEKKAIIRELKSRYGRDWKGTVRDAVGSLKIDKETMHTLHGTGADLRSYNDPRAFRR